MISRLDFVSRLPSVVDQTHRRACFRVTVAFPLRTTCGNAAAHVRTAPVGRAAHSSVKKIHNMFQPSCRGYEATQ